ncbi:MAG: hypothetical protein AAF389_12035 [Gemmatimonadota bacterium]
MSYRSAQDTREGGMDEVVSRTVRVVAGVLVGFMVAGGASGQMPAPEQIDLALSLLPPSAREATSVVLRDETGDVLERPGDGPFVCVSDASNPNRISVLCHHKTLDGLMLLKERLRAESGLRGSDFRALLCERVGPAGVVAPAGAMEIMGSLPRTATGYASEMTVTRLLYVPFETTIGLGIADEDPGDGRPWLHHAGTCGAHVMWSEVRSTAR